jgi:hypothetical protein
MRTPTVAGLVELVLGACAAPARIPAASPTVGCPEPENGTDDPTPAPRGEWRSTRTRGRWLRGLIAAVALAAACGGDAGPTSVGDSTVGTYVLRTANGASIPAVVEETPARLEILSGRITLNADRTFENEIQIRSTESGVTTAQALLMAGTYSVRGSTLTLVDPDAGQIAVVIGGGTITVSEGAVTLVYRR